MWSSLRICVERSSLNLCLLLVVTHLGGLKIALFLIVIIWYFVVPLEYVYKP